MLKSSHNKSQRPHQYCHDKTPPQRLKKIYKTTKKNQGLGINKISHKTFFSKSSSQQPPLSIEFKPSSNPHRHQSQLSPFSRIERNNDDIPAITPEPIITTLNNGMKVVTHNRKSFPISHMSLSIDMGSRYENITNREQGITHLMERSILRSTTNRPLGTLIRDMAKLGCDISTNSSRENFIISATTPTRINPVLGALADIVINPAFNVDQVEADKLNCYYDSVRREHHQRDAMMNEYIHNVAFGNVGLGQSKFPTKNSLLNITNKSLQQWHRRFFTPDRMVLSGVNVNHNEFVALAEEMFQKLPTTTTTNGDMTTTSSKKSTFTRRTVHNTKYQQGGLSQLALYWEGPNIHSTYDASAALLLRQILGTGSPSSQGGPGKGMNSRLYKLVRENTWIPLLDSFSINYSDIGLFGIYGLVGSEASDYFIDVIRDELLTLPDTLDDNDVHFARERLKQNIFAQSSSDLLHCETLARHVQLFGKSQQDELLKNIDQLDTQAMKKLANKLFCDEEYKPGLVTFGEVSRFLPRDIATEFKLVIRDDDDDDDDDNADDDGEGDDEDGSTDDGSEDADDNVNAHHQDTKSNQTQEK